MHGSVRKTEVTLYGKNECGAVIHGSLEVHAPALRNRHVKPRALGRIFHYDPDPNIDEIPGIEDYYEIPPPATRDEFTKPGQTDPRTETVLELENGDWLTALMDDGELRNMVVDVWLMFQSELDSGDVELYFLLLSPHMSDDGRFYCVGQATAAYASHEWKVGRARFFETLEMLTYTVV
jgi:hypothetical protein